MKQNIVVFIGTYTEPSYRGKGEGIYSYRMSPETGSLEPLGKTLTKNPAYIALDPAARRLYCVNELREYAGKPSGAVSSFSIDPDTHALERLNTVASEGSDPCHIVLARGLTPAMAQALVSNYSSGSVCVLPIAADGSLEEASQLVRHEGSSVNTERQAGPHAHSLWLDPSRRYAFVCDLGLDKLAAYRYEGGAPVPLSPVPGLDFSTEPGAGPRHCAFHPSGKFCYLIDELSSSIEALSYRPAEGRLARLQTLSALPDSARGVANTSARVANTSAAIRVSPDGRFLYASNRGHDSIVLYRIDEASGALTYVESEPCGGRGPRDFMIDPSGGFLLVANQASDNVVAFRIEGESGRLSKLREIEVPTPVCIAAYSI